MPGTQAFASPPDMASSSVWENIVPCKTPTFDGVCGIFLYIIFIHNFNFENCQRIIFVQYVEDDKSTFNVGYDRCCCHNIVSIIVVGRCYLPKI